MTRDPQQPDGQDKLGGPSRIILPIGEQVRRLERGGVSGLLHIENLLKKAPRVTLEHGTAYVILIINMIRLALKHPIFAEGQPQEPGGRAAAVIADQMIDFLDGIEPGVGLFLRKGRTCPKADEVAQEPPPGLRIDLGETRGDCDE